MRNELTIYDVEITNRAIFSVNNIADYLSEYNERYANYVRDTLKQKMLSLETLPRRYPRINNEGAAGFEFRGMFVFSYIVVYEVIEEKKTVKILNVLPAKFGMDYIYGNMIYRDENDE